LNETEPSPLSVRRSRSEAAGVTPRKILVIRLSSIGDVVLVTPLLRNLRRHFSEAQIDVVVKASYADLLRHHPAISRLHEVNPERGRAGLQALGKQLREQRYDVALDVHKNFRSLFLARAARAPQVLRYKKFYLRRWLLVHAKLNFLRRAPPIRQRYLEAAAALGVIDDGGAAELFWTEAEEKAADRLLRSAGWNGRSTLIALAPGAGFFTKRWPVESFAETARALVARGYFVVILGGEQDRDLAAAIQRGLSGTHASLAGQTGLLVTAAILKRCHALISNDSGVMHLAEAVGTPLAAIFGSTTRELGFFPQRPASRVLENITLRCRPCSHLGKAKCPKGHFLCMKAIAPEQVLAVLDDLLVSEE
jgi:heptosyltransferase-2